MTTSPQTVKLIAFHGDHKLKEQIIAETRHHRAEDRLIHGTYQHDGVSGFRGCAVGCSIHSLNKITGSTWRTDDHSCYEPGFGVPRVLARLQDGIFEGLELGESLEWPLQFWEAIPVGVDLSMVWPQFALWLLSDVDHGVVQHAKWERIKAIIESVAALYRRWIGGDKPIEKEWRSAAEAAAAAAADAAAAAAAEAAYAAYAAADAADAADAAAYAAAYAAADAAYVKKTARHHQSAKLLNLLRTA